MIIIDTETNKWEKENITLNGEERIRFSQGNVKLDLANSLERAVKHFNPNRRNKFPGTHSVIFGKYDFCPFIVVSKRKDTAISLIDVKLPEGYDRIVNFKCSKSTFVLEFECADGAIALVASTMRSKGDGKIEIHVGDEKLNTEPKLITIDIDVTSNRTDVDITKKITEGNLPEKYRYVDRLPFYPYRPYGVTSKVYVKRSLLEEVEQVYGSRRTVEFIPYSSNKELESAILENRSEGYIVGSLYSEGEGSEEEADILVKHLKMSHIINSETGRIKRLFNNKYLSTVEV